MLLYNADVEEGDRQYLSAEHEDGEDEARQAFFDLRQRTLQGMEQLPAFRVVSLGLLRKLRTNMRGALLYGEVEDALGRYFRLLDSDMQKFASLHETLKDAADKLPSSTSAASSSSLGISFFEPAPSPLAPAVAAAQSQLHEGMRQIAVVLLACGEMQRRALDLKLSAQRAVAQCDASGSAVASFGSFADFLDEALAVGEQLRRRREELQQLRMRAMASVVDAKMAAAAAAQAKDSGYRSNASAPNGVGA
eukprot:TRINITY_DN114607_c0_g1_i1.p1 TRINITY_DN114607_c0_g1~~TRINITY_DN114607_c0_g1_i1.p1  ORF type:complete len:250 (+),score=82.52 TRINITY_DN114607_c0_g1_i1:113-862(+)